MKAVAIYSGGMDSFTMVREMVHAPNLDDLACLSFNYGQRHAKELECAKAVCGVLEIEHHVVNLRALTELLGGSALTDKIEVPEGHYAEDNMKATVVPNRNMIMLSIATGWAVSKDFDAVYTAVHAGDHDIYPDCREEFVLKMSDVCQIANYRPININAPYLHTDKAGILLSGASNANLDVLDYAETWTCYKGLEKACGRCGSCVERLEAFDKVGWEDPLEYADLEFWRDALANA